MNKYLFFAICTFLLISTFSLNAQDLIVTTRGDSLNCKITKQHDGVVYYNFLKNNVAIASSIDIHTVADVVKGYYGTNTIPLVVAIPGKNDYSKWLFGFHAGYSLRTARETSAISQIQKGFSAGADLHRLMSKASGIGLKYKVHKYGGASGINLKGGTSTHYIAASLLKRSQTEDKKAYFVLGANIGYQIYAVNLGYYGAIKGNNLGYGLEAGYEHKMSGHTLFHLGLGLNAGTIKQIEVNGAAQKLDKENYIGLTRFDLTIGLRFGK
ncbi:hypothetical protein [Dyadobacter sp. 32]|uniref:hypothetical protein n=1 Tax=Dyadobacter sp. 32 TaxID=538966 RepID=UPI0011ED5191